MTRRGQDGSSRNPRVTGVSGRAGRRAILVLGMHRSGTSAVARVLGLCGGTLPPTVLPADEHNETGYWEPEAVVRLHDDFLSANGSWFDDGRALPPNWHRSPLAADYAGRLGEVLEDAYGGAPLWVIKDPRLCRLVPLWRRALDRLKVEPLAVLPVRNPLEVAASLGKRDGFSLPKSLLLWLRHFLDAEGATRDVPRSFVLYESLLQDWRRAVGRIGRELGIDWPRPVESAAPEVETFLDAARRHHASSPLDLAGRPDVSPWVWTAYQWAVSVAQGRRAKASVLDEIRHALAAADLVFPPLPADWRRDRINLAETLTKIPRLVTEIRDLQQKLAGASDEAEALRREVAASAARAEQLASDSARARSELESARARQQSELTSKEAHYRSAEQSMEEQRRAELDAERVRHQTELESVRARLRSELASTEARHQSARQSMEDERRAELDAERTRHRSELESTRARLEATRAELELARATLQATRARASENALSPRRRPLDPLRTLSTTPARVSRWLSRSLRLTMLGIDAGAARLVAGGRGGRRNPLRLWRHRRLLRRSGLFDEAWYLREYPDVAASGLDPLIHYLCFGAAEGRDPNPLFSTGWYLRRNPDVAASGLNPLLHFSQHGATEGRDPGPGFATAWYRAENEDVARRGLNPLAHYLECGRLEKRSPRPPESSPEISKESAGGLPQSADAYAAQVLCSPNVRDPAHRGFERHAPPAPDIKAVAFYLPQFHPIPENDQWWGRGFTEWTNVSRAVPQFIGHDQPRLPGELGFYDLRLPDVQRRQVDLARNYGIHAFCFHFYWFGGRRLLERPLDQFLADPSLDLSFCLCWANENWSRRWDGSENEILIAQQHSAEDDLNLIRQVSGAFSDPRYLRAGGRPIFVVYRVDLLPDARQTAERWRRHCRDHDIGEILLVAAQTFGTTDPRPFGFDAAVEFPPHGKPEYHPFSELAGANPAFTGRVFSYEALAAQSKHRTQHPYPLIRTVSPSWDNTARRLERASIYHGSSPQAYRSWLETACAYADAHPIRGERLVFINAWNEWGEAAYLEPDRRYGYAYLDATRSALAEWRRGRPARAGRRRIVLVTHNALDHGAQQIALHVARGLNRHFRYDVDVIDCGLAHIEGRPVSRPNGKLIPLFQQEARVHDFTDDYPDEKAQEGLLQRLRREGVDVAICNTTVTGSMAAMLKRSGFRVVSLLHEMSSLVRECRLANEQRAIAEHADRVVCASDLVRDAFLESCPEARARTTVRHQGLYKVGGTRDVDRSRSRARLGLPTDARIVLGVGYADLRKGFDIFVRVSGSLAGADRRVHVVWLGCELPELRHWAQHDAERLGFADRMRLLPRVDEVSDYYAAADLFLLTSREDPFPSVALESLAHGVPVLAFEGATGAAELLRRGCGVSVPYGQEGEMADAALRLLRDAPLRAELGTRGRALVASAFDWRDYLHFLLEQLGERHHRVSVVVPNYNYARYLPLRLESIFAQSYPIREVIVLDDASTDESVGVVERLREERGWDLTLITSPANSGSVFQQWLRGAEVARGDVLWIAEADDLADPDFLAQVLAPLEDPEVVLAYAQSRQIDDAGRHIAPDYLDYVRDVHPDKWTRSWVRDGREELRDALVVKNTIPSVSAVVSRREPFARVLREQMSFIREFRVAGDHATYVRLLARGGKIAFVDRVLSSHRRHSRGVTLQAFGMGLLREVGRLQTEVYEAVGATPEASVKADRYLGELYEQFGLSKGGASWREDPELLRLSQHPLYAVPRH